MGFSYHDGLRWIPLSAAHQALAASLAAGSDAAVELPESTGESRHLLRRSARGPAQFELVRLSDGFVFPARHKVSTANSRLAFLGTGTSEGVPRVTCLTAQPPTCRTCLDTLSPLSRNKRFNTSFSIRHTLHSDGKERHIVIDTGKFFWHSALRWFRELQIHDINAIVLTHGHFDAMGGLDDLRDFTYNLHPLDIYADRATLDICKRSFGYLFASGVQNVSTLNWHEIDTSAPFCVEGLWMQPIPVPHGSTSCLGFRFGNVAYFSDISEMPQAVAPLLSGVEVLILDALEPTRHPSHFSLPQSVEVVRRVRAPVNFFVGMCHELEHEETNRWLAEHFKGEALSCALAFDGLEIAGELHNDLAEKR